MDIMGCYVLLLYFDLVPEHLKARYENRLVELIRENGGCLDTGFLGTPFLLDTLCKMGRNDLAWELLWQDKCPSWLYEVDQGATTIWESWVASDDNGEPLGISLNHYAFGCVDDWMYRYIGGVEPTSPGYRTFKISLHGWKQFTEARRMYESEYGRILCEWKKGAGKLYLHLEVPCNTQAEIVFPDGTSRIAGSGKYDIYMDY